MNLVTIKELSKILKVKTSTLYGWVHTGRIPFVKLNGLLRFDMDEVQEWVENSKSVSPKIPKTLKKSSNLDIDAIVKKAVESVRQGRYNPKGREASPNQGLGRED